MERKLYTKLKEEIINRGEGKIKKRNEKKRLKKGWKEYERRGKEHKITSLKEEKRRGRGI